MRIVKNILLVGLTLLLVTGCQSSSKKKDTLKIGIIQIVEHPALDAAREGFIEQLAELGYTEKDNLVIDYKNAQGDMNTLNTIAQGFANDKVDLIFAIATPSAQAAANATKDIPILFTAVTDPVEAKLVATSEVPGANITGTSDAVSVEKQFDLLKEVAPQATKVGILFNTSEVNSQVQVKQAKEVAAKMGLTIVEKGVTTSNEIQLGLESMAKDIDALYIPTDNLIASSMPVLTPIAATNKIIIIGSERAHVEAGALMTDGISYKALGMQTAKMAVEVLKGSDISKMPVETLKETQVVVNQKTAKALGIEISKSILDRAEIIE